MQDAALPSAPFFCPVYERAVVFLWIWQDPDGARIRMFCEDCAHADEYRSLPKEQRTILSYEGFQRFAARRLLSHIVRSERGRKAGVKEHHEDGASIEVPGDGRAGRYVSNLMRIEGLSSCRTARRAGSA